ncbi:hypothetical protein REPUB_Repub19eG0006500 [Reevesia pubescens]
MAKSIKLVMVDHQGEQLKANAYTMKDIFGNVELRNKYLDEFTQSVEEIPLRATGGLQTIVWLKLAKFADKLLQFQ